MSPGLLPPKRVDVLRDPYCFLVRIDQQPVLRCTIRREAMRYAVLVRQALRRAGPDDLPLDGAGGHN